MGCGSSKESPAAAPTENARPAQTTGGAAPQVTQRHDQASAGQHPASAGAVTEKAASPQRNKDNPVVYFDISIGGMFLLLFLFLMVTLPACFVAQCDFCPIVEMMRSFSERLICLSNFIINCHSDTGRD
jgi:hypothetical protein